MNQHLQNALSFIEQSAHLSAEEKAVLRKSVLEADKELEITAFKLHRTEKVKRTTGILLEETISELEQKRKAVEAQNRELEIEAALERVRTVAMSMNKPDDMLEACKTISQQLELLNVKEIRNVQTAIFYEAKKTYTNFEYYAKHDKKLATETTYNNNEIHEAFATQMLKGDGEFFSTHIKDVKEWIGYQKTTNVFIDDYLYTASSLSYYWYSLGPVALGISTYAPLNEDELALFKRFRNVFELAYRRFMDIEQALAQAREAQIEAALERVRSRAMAMHKTDELLEAAELLYRELTALGLSSMNVSYAFVAEDEKSASYYSVNPVDGKTIPFPFIFPHTETEVMRSLLSSWKKQEPFNVIELDEAATLTHQTYIGEHILQSIRNNNIDIPFSVEAFLEISPKKAVIYSFNFTHGYLFNIGSERLTSSQEEMLLRFTRVFELTYRRFLDLQKAEAQSREAQIELALERVRARTMAMQRSDELANVATVLFQQVKALGVSQWTCGFGIFEIDDEEFTWYSGSADGDILTPVKVPLTEHPVFISMNESRKRGDELFVFKKEGEYQVGHYRYMQSLPGMGGLLQKLLDVGLSIPTFQIDHYANFSHGNLIFITYEPVPEMHDVFKRFAKVFEQTYTRFLDLQKAEAQAREAQIELGLERVRAKAMAMQKSEELSGLVATLFEELTKLNLVLYRCVIWIFNPDTLAARVWMANSEDKQNAASYFIKRLDHPYYEAIIQGWKDRATKWVYDLQGADKKSIDQLLLTETELAKLPGAVKEGILSSEHTIVSGSFNNFGLIEASGPVPETEEQLEILNRFGKVFDLTYTRFNDLKQAEANAREAQVEAGLERVRARTMAMHNSEDVSIATATLFIELEKLGIENFRGGFTNIRKNKTQEVWSINTLPDGTVIRAIGEFDMTLHPFWQQLYVAWENKEDFFSFNMSGKDKVDYIKILDARRDYLPNGIQDLPDCIVQAYYFGEGGIWTFSLQPHSEEDKQVMKKFASVFSLTFRRYQDLKRAEAQAKEARIETALERVRSKAMAMHNSEDLTETIKTFYHQVEELSTIPRRLGIGIINKENHTADLTTMNTTQQGESIELMGILSLTGHPVLEGIYDNWLSQTEYRPVLHANEIKQYYEIVRPQISYPEYPADTHQYGYFFYFPEGSVYAWTEKEMAEEDLKIYRRFTSVLSLTYRRFKELKEAEAQTRQAQIETAMEKVRARALAMQKPGELTDVATVLRKEMGLLGVEELETSSIYTVDEATGNTSCWYAFKKGSDTETMLVNDHMIIQLNDTWVGREMLEFYQSDKKQVSIPMRGEQRKEWIQYCMKHSKVIEGFYGDTIPDRIYHLNKFSNGYIGAASPGDISAESWDLLQRATSVFSLAYTRFSDLQKSEANTREAVRRAALDRVRAEIASMRTVADLEKITPLVWNELTILGIPFIRCGVFIMDESNEMIHTFLSTPEGKAIAAFHIPYQTPGNIGQVLQHWHEKTVYVDRWDETAFTQFAATLVKQGALASPEAYLKTIPHGGFYLHFLPFLQGMLYVGNTDPLEDEEISLVQSVAEAFSTAYARYEDFNKLESANTQIELTLKDLKQAQTQLIQSEKMASLGELTAGIAHEIQNPLNFVNNFSEINTELIEELEQEARKGNYAEVHAIAKDIRDNEQKINHHGKRADAIVKGMLEHSRSSIGIKVPTDINKLADEYLRLAYHGLRAKDKSFNATLNTSYDESLGLLNIIPQDIGRVLLNLINNAFYAVAEKKKGSPRSESYEPIITVSTKAVKPPLGGVGATVLITIADNGNGIPQKILDKIFQPFFTTKPTGQGTGLGLSLAYDIVKAHGGELKVKTQEDEGSEFVIVLPANF